MTLKLLWDAAPRPGGQNIQGGAVLWCYPDTLLRKNQAFCRTGPRFSDGRQVLIFHEAG